MIGQKTGDDNTLGNQQNNQQNCQITNVIADVKQGLTDYHQSFQVNSWKDRVILAVAVIILCGIIVVLYKFGIIKCCFPLHIRLADSLRDRTPHQSALKSARLQSPAHTGFTPNPTVNQLPSSHHPTSLYNSPMQS
ncbi:unnamed protein product [Didymodactylos carnosus]|uniref:Uncharacterized protein n=1 Tax=Didymodactylos carnosus TaxID=1234261 RepID=A0A814HXK7_9BILA|nr:unnamed protein product [Didymodactylos carnosus]CAF1015958.1 unnamed protein product [Didymodactylos carnosus]CAF3603166.1 unnamed protein product [Didymodactylos carnosus]CAF3787471.1 unnamed protein product [Didymodactylos carnosus]